MQKLLCALLATLVIAGCAASGTPTGRRITIEMRDFTFSPSRVEVRPGEQITWVLRNVSPHLHQFESQEARIQEVNVPPGETQEVNWTAPRQPGSYTIVCGIHEALGMKMTVVVKE